jgi:ribosomal protein L3
VQTDRDEGVLEISGGQGTEKKGNVKKWNVERKKGKRGQGRIINCRGQAPAPALYAKTKTMTRGGMPNPVAGFFIP